MDILIFSDSHGRTDGMFEILQRQPKRPDAVLFLGDGLRDAAAVDWQGSALYAVRGNCDLFVESIPISSSQECVTAMGGHTLFLTHGANYDVKHGLGALIREAARRNADLVLFGHTHRPYLEVIAAGEVIAGRELTRPMYLFNPGSIGRGVDGSGGSFGTLTLQGEQVLFSHGKL